jgi:hypothetical protein
MIVMRVHGAVRGFSFDNGFDLRWVLTRTRLSRPRCPVWSSARERPPSDIEDEALAETIVSREQIQPRAEIDGPEVVCRADLLHLESLQHPVFRPYPDVTSRASYLRSRPRSLE